jgi:hypothetical protein
MNALGMESLGFAGSTGSTVSNVTAIASGVNSAGIQSRYSDSADESHTLTLGNSIAEGASDLRTEDGPGTARIVVSNSNFDSAKAASAGTIAGPANQTAAPLFVDAASGDYQPAVGSPTIDAGASGELGPFDLAGNPRVQGAAPDIGAYEFAPPPPALPATGTLTALALSPPKFKPRKGGGAIVSAARAPKAKVGTTVRYSISAAATVEFTVLRVLKGRLVGGKCRRQTHGNRRKKRCARLKSMKGGFAHQGVTGQNSFEFSGRIGGRALGPGRYRLVGRSGASIKRAAFRIVPR